MKWSQTVTNSSDIPGRFEQEVLIGVIQTNVDFKSAWRSRLRVDAKGRIRPMMYGLEQQFVIQEINYALRAFKDGALSPQIILIPELSVPRAYLDKLAWHGRGLDAVIIAGFDYRHGGDEPDGNLQVWNEALAIVPQNWQSGRKSRTSEIYRIGKADPAPEENYLLGKGLCTFQRESVFWLFDAGRFGTLGVAVCSDLMDLERSLLYRGRVEHYLVLAYNRDTTSFSHIAESVARTVYCNVVVCNTGFYGGTLAVSPYREPFRRTTYRHDGQGMLAYQVIALPVLELLEARQSGASGDYDSKGLFKSVPPRLDSSLRLSEKKAAF
jgi:hypothetical protein